ncbi:GntR family transcriptional regulator [Variovorax defluvii]|uniref:GntR family transcriptional regulator n=1 Tax=Variovorax defluvii TaxID=913761 RepID=UPI0031EBDB74
MEFEAFLRPKDVGLQLSGSVASHLREQIISGKLKSGEFLRIDSIASDLGVSTTPVREGLLLLQSESFVRLLPRRGFVVNSFSKDDLRDIFWAQAIVGAELAARAALKITKEDLAKLQQLDTEHEKAFKAGDERHVQLGYEFHRFLNLAAGSPRLALLLGSLSRQLPNRFYASIEGQVTDTLKYHPIIIDAIRMKDAEAVRSLMFRHIMHGAEHLIQSLERAGTWGPPTEAANAPVAEPETEEVAEPKVPRVARTAAAKSSRKAKPARAARR